MRRWTYIYRCFGVLVVVATLFTMFHAFVSWTGGVKADSVERAMAFSMVWLILVPLAIIAGWGVICNAIPLAEQTQRIWVMITGRLIADMFAIWGFGVGCVMVMAIPSNNKIPTDRKISLVIAGVVIIALSLLWLGDSYLKNLIRCLANEIRTRSARFFSRS